MVSIESQIWANIQQKGRGAIFFPSDFTDFGETKAVGKSLERLTAKGQIVRVAQGIYCYPIIETELGLGVIRPTFEQIAEAVANRDKARIVPTGIYALNRLGLSTQVPMNCVYLTDGSSRKIVISDGRGITFKNTAPKNLAFTSPLAMLITSALKSLKKENVTSEEINRINYLLHFEKKETVLADLPLMPAWVRAIVTKAYA